MGVEFQLTEEEAFLEVVAALEGIAESGCCRTEGCSIDDPLCTTMEARAALEVWNNRKRDYAKTNLLGIIFGLQKSFMDKLVEKGATVTSQRAAIGMVEEAFEVFKLYSKKLNVWNEQDIDPLELLEEATDVLFYLVELLITLEFDPTDLFNSYSAKMLVNTHRLNTGEKDKSTEKALYRQAMGTRRMR